MEALRKPPTPLPKCMRLERRPSSDPPMVDGACQEGPNVHAAVSALVEKVSSQSDAFADFYYSLERMRQRNLAEILASQSTATAAKSTAVPEELQRNSEEEAGDDVSTRVLLSKESTLARGLLATRRDTTKMMFSQLDALHSGKMRTALNEALTQLSALEDEVLPAVEARIEARRKEALVSTERAMNTLAAKVREAEEEEGNVDAAIWEAETVLALLTTQASTMRRVISKRHEITETGLEEVLAAEAEEERQRQEDASRAAADVLRSVTIGL